jgi:peptidoglycan/xylan/chitin deacetylase (PgdA/CDA1 family)
LVALVLPAGCEGGGESPAEDSTAGGSSSGGTSSGGADQGGTGGQQSADPCVIDFDTQSYNHDLNVPRSQNPPGGLAPADVPQFVALGWDDNGFLEAFNWSINMLRVRQLKTSYFLTTTYVSDGSIMGNPGFLRGAWNGAYRAGHEIGNHTQYHLDGEPFSGMEWGEEIDTALEWLTAPYESEDMDEQLGIGVSRSKIYGFRSPFLNYNDVLFEELKERGFWYDCSIEEGWQLDEDASQFAWPYTLDEGSAAHDYAEERGFEAKDFPLSKHPGLFELPAYALVIPPDEVAEDYNITPGLLDRIRDYIPEREADSDRITGLDYNLWWEAHLTKEEALAILKYNLDQRLSGNRAPFLFGVHTDFYRDGWGSDETHTRRREAIEEFLDYASGLEDVRVTTFKEVLDYMREPRPLECYAD